MMEIVDGAWRCALDDVADGEYDEITCYMRATVSAYNWAMAWESVVWNYST